MLLFKVNSEIWSSFNIASVKVSSIGGIAPFCDFSGSQFLLITTLFAFKRRSLFWIWHYLIFFGPLYSLYSNALTRVLSSVSALWKEKCLQARLKFSVCDIRAVWTARMFQCRNKASVTWKLKSSRFPSRQVALCLRRKPYVISLSKVRADFIFCLVLIKQLFRYLISHNQVEEKRKKKW